MNEREFLKKMKYTKPVADNELGAIRRVMILKEFIGEVTHQHIERELSITRAANERKAVQAVNG